MLSVGEQGLTGIVSSQKRERSGFSFSAFSHGNQTQSGSVLRVFQHSRTSAPSAYTLFMLADVSAADQTTDRY